MDNRVAPEEPSAGAGSGAAAYLELTKPGIAVFVMLTAGVGYWVGSGGVVVPTDLVNMLLGTLVATGGALALNQYVERDKDAVMLRTRGRPIPSGRVTPVAGLNFGATLFLAGTVYLAASVGPVPAALTVGSTIAYVFVYTPLKTRSYLATPAGAVPGAVPVLIGWSTATGGLSSGAWVLFAIGFLWQLPHVLALGWLLREDYSRAGFFLIPPADPDGWKIGKHLLLYTTALVPVSLAPTLLGLAGGVYFWGALALGLAFVALCLPAARHIDNARARRAFLASLAYHPLWMGLLVFDTLPL